MAAALLRRPDIRLLVLTGPGGVGKTRLALRIATDVAADFPDGVWFVPLAPITDTTLVLPAIAQTLEIRDSGDRGLEDRLAEALRERALLLVLDNFEQVLGAAPVITDLLFACPHLKVLVTSRARLHLSGEHAFPVPPLILPHANGATTLEQLHESEAVRLFLTRARAIHPSFAPADHDAFAVAEICRRVDGLPLAIELAAAWVSILPPTVLRDRLQPRLPLLTGGGRDLPPRQHTMRDAIAWSHGLLDPTEQALFRHLAIFVGGLTLKAAEHVAGAGRATAAGEVLQGVSSLVDKSLLVPGHGPCGEPRFTMLETIREFALEQLAGAGEESTARDAHAEYFVAWCEQAAALSEADQAAWYRRLDADLGNVRAAMSWLLARGRVADALRLSVPLHNFWITRPQPAEGRRWLEAALAGGTGDPITRVDALFTLASLAALTGDLPAAVGHAEEGLALATQHDYRFGIGRALYAVGVVAEWSGDLGQAAERFEAALPVLRSIGETKRLSVVLWDLGTVYHWLGDPDRGSAYAQESLMVAQRGGDARNAAMATLALAMIACERGDLSVAAPRFANALDQFSALNDLRDLAGTIAAAANLALKLQQPERAARLLGSASAICDEIGTALMAHHHEYERLLAIVRQQLVPNTFATAWDAGRGASVEQATAQVGALLEDASATRRAGTPADRALDLTPRQVEVLQLLADGLTDRQIAQMLFLSPRTVHHHVARALTKLGVSNRTAAVAAARANGLLSPAAATAHSVAPDQTRH